MRLAGNSTLWAKARPPTHERQWGGRCLTDEPLFRRPLITVSQKVSDKPSHKPHTETAWIFAQLAPLPISCISTLYFRCVLRPWTHFSAPFILSRLLATEHAECERGLLVLPADLRRGNGSLHNARSSTVKPKPAEARGSEGHASPLRTASTKSRTASSWCCWRRTAPA